MKQVKVFVAMFFVCVLSACALADVKKEERPKDEQYLPFMIMFKADGTPVITGRDGEVVQGEEVSFPVKATSVDSLETISFIKYTGSCKVIMYIAGKYLQYTLPDWYCEQETN